MSKKWELELERQIATKVVECLIKADFTVSVNDGEEIVLQYSTDVPAILAAMFSTDEDYLLVHDRKSGRSRGWVRLLHGNGVDMISDYTINLESAIKDANDFAEQWRD